MAVASLVSGLTSSWPLFLRASSLLSSSPLELHPLSVYEISFIVLFDIAEIALLVKFFFSFFYLPLLGPFHFSIPKPFRIPSVVAMLDLFEADINRMMQEPECAHLKECSSETSRRD